MRLKRLAAIVPLAGVMTMGVLGARQAPPQTRADGAVLAKIRAEALERSKVLDTFNHLANVIGPRCPRPASAPRR